MNGYIAPVLPRYEKDGTFPFKAEYWYDSRIKKDAMVKVTAFRKGVNSWEYKKGDCLLAWFRVYDFKTPKAYVVINGKNVTIKSMRMLY